MGAILVAVCIYCGFCRKKKVEDKTFLSTTTYEDLPLEAGKATRSTSLKSSDSTGAPGSASSCGLAISVDKSVEFSYEELAKATNDFSIAQRLLKVALELSTMLSCEARELQSRRWICRLKGNSLLN